MPPRVQHRRPTRRCCSTSICSEGPISSGSASSTRECPYWRRCAPWNICRPWRAIRGRPSDRAQRRARSRNDDPARPVGARAVGRPAGARRPARRLGSAAAAGDPGAGQAHAGGASPRGAQPRAVAAAHARRARPCARELSSVAIDDPGGARGGAPELPAVPPAHARPARAGPQGLPALERASQGAPAGAAEGIRALAAAAAGAAGPDPAAAAPVGGDDSGGARPRAPQSGALAADDPRAAGADPRTLAADAARGARAAAPGAPAAPATATRTAMITRRLIVPALALGLLTGCSASTTRAPGAHSEASPAAVSAAAPAMAATGAAAGAPGPRIGGDRQIVHVLSRLTYGPRPGDLERVRTMGVSAWIDRQLRPETIDDSATERALAELPALSMPITEALRQFPRPDPKLRAQIAGGEMSRQEMLERYPMEKRPVRIAIELQAAKVVRAVSSERQLEEVMVDFWFNHFNVFAGKGDVRWYVSSYERDAIRPYALGRFPDLVRATAYHPAMLFYLDNWLSAKPDFVVPAGPNRGRRAGLNENYARELMELHTLGVDGGYTQKDVTEVARAFTAWTIDRPQVDGRFIFRPIMHDTGEKVVLGQRIAAGGGREDGERVIEILTRHPATARFIATKLVRRFVSDEPPPALVARVAGTYTSTGGDIRAMLRTICKSPEFFSEHAYRAKIKKPFEFVASAVRALGGTTDATGGMALARASAEIGEPLYQAQPPTGYADRGDVWVNAGALLARMNFALGLASGRYPHVSVELAPLVAGADPAVPSAVLDRLLVSIVADQTSEATRTVLTAQLSEPQITRLSPDDRGAANTDVAKLAALVIGSPEFQRR